MLALGESHHPQGLLVALDERAGITISQT